MPPERRRDTYRGYGSLLRRSLALIVVAALVGAVLGWLIAALRPSYESTAVLSVRSTTADAAATATAVESAAVLATSDAVIRSAAATLRTDPAALAGRTSATAVEGTNLVNVTVTAASPADARAAASAITDALVAGYQTRSTDVATRIRQAGEALLKSGSLSAAAAEVARQTSIGETVGAAQGGSISGALAVTPMAPPTEPRPAGVSRTVAALFGAAAGVLLASLVALSRGSRRPEAGAGPEPQAFPGARLSATTADADTVAAAVVDSAQRCVVVLDASGDPVGAENFQGRLCGALRARGVSVGRVLVDAAPLPVTSGGSGVPARMVGAAEAESALSAAGREKLAVDLGCDVAVVSLPAALSAAGRLNGDRDYLPVVLLPGGARPAEVEGLLAPYAGAGPVAVLGT